MHFDITILEDLLAYKEVEKGITQLKILEIFINQEIKIIVERRPVNSALEVIEVLTTENFNYFKQHWSERFSA